VFKNKFEIFVISDLNSLSTVRKFLEPLCGSRSFLYDDNLRILVNISDDLDVLHRKEFSIFPLRFSQFNSS